MHDCSTHITAYNDSSQIILRISPRLQTRTNLFPFISCPSVFLHVCCPSSLSSPLWWEVGHRGLAQSEDSSEFNNSLVSASKHVKGILRAKMCTINDLVAFTDPSQSFSFLSSFSTCLISHLNCLLPLG